MKTDLPYSGEVQQVLSWSEQVGINRDPGVYHRDPGGYPQGFRCVSTGSMLVL